MDWSQAYYLGDETYFLTGTDEHTEKVVEAAKRFGEEAREERVRREREAIAAASLVIQQPRSSTLG